MSPQWSLMKWLHRETPDAGRPGTPWKGAMAQLHGVREADLIDVREVFRMNEWEAVPVNIRIGAMQAPVMGRHGPGRKIHPAVLTWDAAPESLPVGGTIPSAPPTKSLL